MKRWNTVKKRESSTISLYVGNLIMTSSITSKASVSLRDRAKFWRRYEAVQSMGRRFGIFSRLQLSYSRCKARKRAPKLSHAKSDAHDQTVRNTTTGPTGQPYNTGPPRETAHQNSEDRNAPIASQSDYIVKRTISTFLLI